MMDDLFCQIAGGDISVSELWRDDQVMAFLDHRPVFKGHALVIPIQHVATLADLPPSLMPAVFGLAQALATAMQTALEADGSFVAMNNTVSQSVPHLHVHVVPRRRKDGLRGFFWPRTTYAAGEEEQYAATLRAALANYSPRR